MYKVIQYIVFFISLAVVLYFVNFSSSQICFAGEEITIYQKFVIVFGYTTLLFWIFFIVIDYIKNLFVEND